MTGWLKSSSLSLVSSRSSGSSRRQSSPLQPVTSRDSDAQSQSSAVSTSASSHSSTKHLAASTSLSQTRVISNPMPLRPVQYQNSYTDEDGRRPVLQSATILLASAQPSTSSSVAGADRLSKLECRRSQEERRRSRAAAGRENSSPAAVTAPVAEEDGHGQLGREKRYSTYTFDNLQQLAEDDSIPTSLWTDPAALDQLNNKSSSTFASSNPSLDDIPEMIDDDEATPRKPPTQSASHRKPVPNMQFTPPKSRPFSTLSPSGTACQPHSSDDPFRRSGEDAGNPYDSVASRLSSSTSSPRKSTLSPFSTASRLFQSKSRSSKDSGLNGVSRSEIDPVLREVELAAVDADWELVDADGPTDAGRQRSRLGHRGPPVVSGVLLPAPGVRARKKLMSKRSERALAANRDDTLKPGIPRSADSLPRPHAPLSNGKARAT